MSHSIKVSSATHYLNLQFLTGKQFKLTYNKTVAYSLQPCGMI